MIKGVKKRAVVIVCSVIFGLLLAAVAAVLVPILTHQSAGGSGQNLANIGGNSATAHGDDNRTRTLTVTDLAGNSVDMQNLQPGSEIRVTGSGYDGRIGIYVSFCKLPPPGERPTPCLGEVPATKELAREAQGQRLSSAWVTDDLVWRAFATHNWQDAANGSFQVELTVPAVASNGIDCAREECALVTRADHTALQDRVQDIYLPVQFVPSY